MVNDDQDALNQAVDMVRKAGEATFGALKDVAPAVWNKAMYQTKIDGVELLIGASICLALMIVVIVAAVRMRGDGKVELGVLGGGACLVGFILCLVNGMDLYLNPAYWTALHLISKLRGGQ
jgi:hypothetical protein